MKSEAGAETSRAESRESEPGQVGRAWGASGAASVPPKACAQSNQSDNEAQGTS